MERAAQVSRVLFDRAPGVVLAPDRDRAAQDRAAGMAERAHVPLLLAGPQVAAEVRRLGARWLVPVGLDAPRLAGVHVRRAAPEAAGPARPTALLLVLHASADTAAIATAKAAGAQVVPLSATALNADPRAIAALRGARKATPVLVGLGFAGLDAAWAVRVARSDAGWPGGGQVPFDARRLFVALYGVPGDPALGVLGRQGPQQTIARVQALAKQYAPLVHRAVVPMLEIITTVASGGPTDDGDYSSELDVAKLEPYLDAATKAGMPVVLDLQPGRSDFLRQAKQYASLLRRPNVGLALDPEWRLGPKQKPLVQIGRVSAAEVNATSAWLAALVRQHGLPPKMFVLHQFRLTMLEDRSRIVTDRPELSTLIHVDGQGSQPDKQATWRAIRAGAPHVAWGWKNFLQKDHPVLTPRQTIAQVHPTPDLITYQ